MEGCSWSLAQPVFPSRPSLSATWGKPSTSTSSSTPWSTFLRFRPCPYPHPCRWRIPRESALRRSVAAAAMANHQDLFSSADKPTAQKGWISSVVGPIRILMLNGKSAVNTRVTVGIAAIFLAMILGLLVKRVKAAQGSVEELVRRGQLRSDRRLSSRALMYEDPFNNPMVRLEGKNPAVKMCGKVFRLQPVTLTREKMRSHQNRRIEAYQWKRPTVFLSEGEPIPEGVDPEVIRWIPANHPFATTRGDIDEVFAEKNVYQTRGAPSRVRAEHDALRKKMLKATQQAGETDPHWPAMYSEGSHMKRVSSNSPLAPDSEQLN